MRQTVTDKPLHVRVAEALGMEEIKRDGNGMPGMTSVIYINTNRQCLAGCCPRYDTDWSATGPLIEKYGIDFYRCEDWDSSPRWEADRDDLTRTGPTPLIAVCNLILALKAAGKL